VPQLWSLLYLLPFIALIFDLYIVGEDYGIKRMGVFIREAFPLTPEGRWEFSLRRRRDPFSRLALPWATLVVVGGAATLLVVLGRWAGVIPWIWLSASVLAIGALRRDSRRRLIRLEIEAALQHLPTASDSEDARLELLQLLRDYGRAGQDDVVARAGSLLKQVTSAESKESI
jgi:hypothetical protein